MGSLPSDACVRQATRLLAAKPQRPNLPVYGRVPRDRGEGLLRRDDIHVPHDHGWEATQPLTSSGSLIVHVVDRTSGGVPLAVRDYVSHTPEVLHVILAPYANGRPDGIWDGVRADHRDLGGGLIERVRSVRAAVRALRPHAIHAHSSFAGVYARVATSSTREHIVYSPHCFKFDDPAAHTMLRVATRLAERSLARRTSTFAVLSKHEERLARSLHGRAETVIVPNTPTVATRERSDSRSGGSFVVGMVGRLSPQKDPELFRAIRRSADADDMAWIWIGGGDGQYQSRLESDAITVTGWLESDRLTEALDSLDLYVHSAAYEGFPLSVLDAAARRVPIIARRIPALEETPLALFDGADEAASLIARAQADDAFRNDLIDRGDALLSVMDAEHQRGRLYAAWGI